MDGYNKKYKNTSVEDKNDGRDTTPEELKQRGILRKYGRRVKYNPTLDWRKTGWLRIKAAENTMEGYSGIQIKTLIFTA